MKKALISGANGTIGQEIVKILRDLGYFVIGISRQTNPSYAKDQFTQSIQCDLSNKKELRELCTRLKKEDITILINCAGFGRFAPHEELSFDTIVDMSFVNLTSAMLITNATLRSLKKNGGHIININSIEALRTSKFSALYSATKTGLKAFGDSLFEENRKTDLSVTNINPDMTEGNFYDELRFNVSTKDDEKLFAKDIADAIKHILSMRKGAVVSEYTLRSLKFGIKK